MKEIKDKINSHGDIKEIADITGFNESYVRKVINLERNNDLILQVASDIIAVRNQLHLKYANECAHEEENSNPNQDNNKKIETLLHNLKDPSLIVNNNHEIIAINDSFKYVVEQNIEQVFLKNIHEILSSFPQTEISVPQSIKSFYNDNEDSIKDVIDRGDWFKCNFLNLSDNTLIIFKEEDTWDGYGANLEMEKELYWAVVHDIKNKVGNINSITQLALHKTGALTNEELKLFFDRINRNINSLYKITNDLLVWSRKKFQGEKVGTGHHNLYELVQNELDYHEFQIKSKNLNIELTLAPETHFWGDHVLFNIVFDNILFNAIKFTPENGQIKIDGNQEGNWIKVSVEDSGPGMDREVIEKLHGDNPVNAAQADQNDKGNGLGLFLSRYILNKMNSMMEIASEKGNGTTIKFSLPLEPNQS